MEIVIVGAGPIGCYTAQLLKNNGIKARIIEENTEVGKPVRCAGLVGRQVFEKLLLPLDRSSIVNQINGATFFYSGESFQIMRNKVAFVIDREKFDKNLSKGLNVECNKKIIAIKPKASGYILTARHEEIYADFIIGADGANSRIREYVKCPVSDSGIDCEKDFIKNYLGVQYRMKLEENSFNKNTAYVYFRKGITFFTWVIPEGNGIFRIGVASKNNARTYLNEFLRENKVDGEVIDKSAGIIPIGLMRNYYKNIALVGDAAAQVKPLTGGGLYYGLKSAECLVECLKDGKMADYEKRVKSLFGKEIRFGLKARRLYEKVNENEIKNLFNLFKQNYKFIEKAANFERHSVIFTEILKKPTMVRDLCGILGKNIIKLLF